MNQMHLIAKHISRGNGVYEVKQAAKWLTTHILPVLNDIWQPRRVKEWRPGARCNGVTSAGNERLQKLLGDDHAEIQRDEGHDVWVTVPPEAVMLGKWRVGFKLPGCLSTSEWTSMACEASRMAGVAAKKAKAETNKSRGTWAKEATDHGAAAGHAFCRPQQEGLDPLSTEAGVDDDGIRKYVDDVDEVVRRKGAFWHKLWGRDGNRLEELRHWLKEQRHFVSATTRTKRSQLTKWKKALPLCAPMRELALTNGPEESGE